MVCGTAEGVVDGEGRAHEGRAKTVVQGEALSVMVDTEPVRHVLQRSEEAGEHGDAKAPEDEHVDEGEGEVVVEAPEPTEAEEP